MASIKEVLDTRNKWAKTNSVTPEAEALLSDIEGRERIPALTDELLADSLIAKYPEILAGVAAEPNPEIPAPSALLNRFGKRFHIPRSKDPYEDAKNFVDHFSKNADKWKEAVMKDPKLGERGWEAVKSVFQQTAPDVEQETAKRERQEYLSGAQGFITKVLFPRSSERFISGGEIQPKDIALDAGEDLAMSVPGAGFVGAVGKLGRAGHALSKAGPLVKSVAGGAAVPLGAEIADKIAYSEGEGMDHRAEFRPSDVLRGTLINTGAGYGLYKLLGPTAKVLSGDLSGEGTKAARELIGSIGTTSGSRLKDRANAVKEATDAVLKGPIGNVTEGSLTKAGSRGASPATEAVSRETFDNAVTDKAVMDLIDAGYLSLKPKKEVAVAIEKSSAFDRPAYQHTTDQLLEDAGEAALRGNAQEAADLMLRLRQLQKGAERPRAAKASAVLSGVKEAADAPSTMNLSEEAINKAFARNPELYSYILANTKNDLTKPGFWRSTANVLTGYGLPFVENKAGRDEWAGKKANAMLGVIAEPLDRQKASERRRQSSAIQQVLKGPGITPEDELYLRRIQEDPDYLKFNRDDPAFKIWLLQRGHRLLQGTPAHRPLWGVE